MCVKTVVNKSDGNYICCLCGNFSYGSDESGRWDAFFCYPHPMHQDGEDDTTFMVCTSCRGFACDEIQNTENNGIFLRFADNDNLYKADSYSGVNY